MGQSMSVQDFIMDSRLVVWFTQNYDLEGCSAYICSKIPGDSFLKLASGPNSLNVSKSIIVADGAMSFPPYLDQSLLHKVIPIPIGIF